MSQQLKRWESPRERGRNTKGKGGSARARQLRKQQKLLIKKLKANPLSSPDTLPNSNQKLKPINKKRKKLNRFFLFYWRQMNSFETGQSLRVPPEFINFSAKQTHPNQSHFQN
jgi:hypothetical protein